MSPPDQQGSPYPYTSNTTSNQEAHLVALPDISSNPGPDASLEINTPQPLESASPSVEKDDPIAKDVEMKNGLPAKGTDASPIEVDEDGDIAMTDFNRPESPTQHAQTSSPSSSSFKPVNGDEGKQPQEEEEESWELRVNWSGRESFDLKVMASDR